jgi:hypothetical protein
MENQLHSLTFEVRNKVEFDWVSHVWLIDCCAFSELEIICDVTVETLRGFYLRKQKSGELCLLISFGN